MFFNYGKLTKSYKLVGKRREPFIFASQFDGKYTEIWFANLRSPSIPAIKNLSDVSAPVCTESCEAKSEGSDRPEHGNCGGAKFIVPSPFVSSFIVKINMYINVLKFFSAKNMHS